MKSYLGPKKNVTVSLGPIQKMKQLHQFRRAIFETVSFNPPLYDNYHHVNYITAGMNFRPMQMNLFLDNRDTCYQI